MTDAIALALIAGVPLTIGALGTLVVSLKNGAKSDVIIGHVNSEKTAAEGRELTLRAEKKLLQEQIADLRQSAALLAQALALRGGASRASDPISPTDSAAVASLHKIDENTATIAENTSK